MVTTKLSRFLRQVTQLLAFTYCGGIAAYLLLRLLFWDRLWVVGLLGLSMPWTLFPILILPLLAVLVIKKRWFTIGSAIACLWLVGWLQVNYWSPRSIPVSNLQLSLQILSLSGDRANFEVRSRRDPSPDIRGRQPLTAIARSLSVTAQLTCQNI